MRFPGMKTKRYKPKEEVTANVNSNLFMAGVFGAKVAAPDNSAELFETTLEDALAVDYEIFRNYDFPFENLVLEGGGMKGLAYTGALQVLEDINVLQKIKRICGVSIGSIIATFLYVGYSPEGIQKIIGENLGHVSQDHSCGYCSLIPNILKGFGWNPGKRIEKWIGEKIKLKTGDANSTFQQLYDKTGRELCIVVTNLSQLSTEYFHVKTTPNMSIAAATYMSMAIPGMFQCRTMKNHRGKNDVMIDGGLLCNYPIHAFDGWFLSLKEEDSFFKRISSLDNLSNIYMNSERFGGWNDKTIGMLLYANDEIEVMKEKFMRRQGSDLPKPPPNSKHYKHHIGRTKEQSAKQVEENISSATNKLLQELKKIEVVASTSIPLDKLGIALDESTDFGTEELQLLFGCSDVVQAIKEMDENGDGEISFFELMTFIDKKGIDLYTLSKGYGRRDINSFGEYLGAIEAGLSVCLLKSNVEDRDSERTIGINTGYIGTVDFFIEEEDKKFLFECGERGALAFLREYCRHNETKRRKLSKMLSDSFLINRNKTTGNDSYVLVNDKVGKNGALVEEKEDEDVTNGSSVFSVEVDYSAEILIHTNIVSIQTDGN